MGLFFCRHAQALGHDVRVGVDKGVPAGDFVSSTRVRSRRAGSKGMQAWHAVEQRGVRADVRRFVTGSGLEFLCAGLELFALT
jgi:hypothetical protein